MQKSDRQIWDQETLQAVVEKNDVSQHPDFVFHRLPPNFTHIFDYPHDYYSGDVFIEHLQASRETKFDTSHPSNLRRKERVLQVNKSLNIDT